MLRSPSFFSKYITEPDVAIFPVITNLLYMEVLRPNLSLVVLALIAILSPTLASVTVVVPTMKSFHPLPVLYSNETSGALEPTFYMETVEFAYSAVKVNGCEEDAATMWGTIALSDHPLATIHWSYNDSGTYIL